MSFLLICRCSICCFHLHHNVCRPINLAMHKYFAKQLAYINRCNKYTVFYLSVCLSVKHKYTHCLNHYIPATQTNYQHTLSFYQQLLFILLSLSHYSYKDKTHCIFSPSLRLQSELWGSKRGHFKRWHSRKLTSVLLDAHREVQAVNTVT